MPRQFARAAGGGRWTLGPHNVQTQEEGPNDNDKMKAAISDTTELLEIFVEIFEDDGIAFKAN